MKKSTFLTFATVGAIAATSAGTYAVWDTATATNTGTFTMANQVVLSSTTATTYTGQTDRALNVAPEYKGTVQFDVANKSAANVTSLDINSVKVYAQDDTAKATPLEGNFDITVVGATGNSDVKTPVSGNALATDTSVETSNSYEVTLTAKDTDGAKNLAGKELTVEVAGELK